MPKYGLEAQRQIAKALHEFEAGELKSGRSKTTVKSRKQALAIGISKARDKGTKVPKLK